MTSFPSTCREILWASCRISPTTVCALLTYPAPSQYGQGVHKVRSRLCFTLFRVIATSPKSLNWRILYGARSARMASSRACITFWRFRSAQGAFQALLHPLPGNRHQPEIIELENLIRRAIGAHGFFEGLHHLLAIQICTRCVPGSASPSSG